MQAIRNPPFQSEGSAQAYLLAVLAVAAMTPLRYGLNPFMGMQSPFILFSIAIIVTALYGGLLPALLATALSALSGAWLFLPPESALGRIDATQYVQIVVFAALGISISLLGGRIKAWQSSAAQSE